MQQDLISVIIPCYNVEKFIKDCIDSLCSQTYKNYEAIFINDGSTDRTPQLLESLCKDKPNFKIVTRENGGLSAARNSGLEIAGGEYIAFLDSDDMYRPNYLEALYSLLTDKNLDVAMCSFECVKENAGADKLKRIKIKSKPTVYDNAEEVICRIMTNWNLHFAPWNKLLRRSLLEKTGRFPRLFDENTRYCEDIEFSYRCMSCTDRVGVIKEKLYCYRTRKGSICHSSFNANKLTAFNGINAVISDADGRFGEGLKYCKAYAGVMAMELLWRMHSADYQNAGKILEMFDILGTNMKYITSCKFHPWWRRAFSPLALKFLKLCHCRRLKKLKTTREEEV